MASKDYLARELEARRHELGMSLMTLAKRSGVSKPTVYRILSGGLDRATVANVLAIAEALGMVVRFDPTTDADEFLEREARQKAKRLVSMVQGTLGLESQAVDEAGLNKMIRRTLHELLAGSKRKLWSE